MKTQTVNLELTSIELFRLGLALQQRAANLHISAIRHEKRGDGGVANAKSLREEAFVYSELYWKIVAVRQAIEWAKAEKTGE